MKTRNGSHDEVPSDGSDLESWLHDLVGGERSARRFREQLDTTADSPCAVCEGAATGKIYFGPDGHLPGRLSA